MTNFANVENTDEGGFLQYDYHYKGFYYCPWDDVDDDVVKTWHQVRSNGKVLYLPLSVYDRPTYEYFKLWVDAGCPYPSRGIVSKEQLMDIIVEKSLLSE